MSEDHLIKITRYVSPQYLKKFDKVIPGTDVDRPDTIKYKVDPKEAKIIEWLGKNTLFGINNAYKELSHSDRSYFFQGREGVACLIYPDHVEINPPAPLVRGFGGSGDRDINYEWRLTIRHQPSDRDLPSELVQSLWDMGFEKVDAFSKDRVI